LDVPFLGLAFALLGGECLDSEGVRVDVSPATQARPARPDDNDATGISDDGTGRIDTEHRSKIENWDEIPVGKPVQHRSGRLAIHTRHDDIAAGEQRLVSASDEPGVPFDSSHQSQRFGVSGGNVNLVGPTYILLPRTHYSREIGFLDEVTVEQDNLSDAKMRELHRHQRANTAKTNHADAKLSQQGLAGGA
jgi:hypothetical protein